MNLIYNLMQSVTIFLFLMFYSIAIWRIFLCVYLFMNFFFLYNCLSFIFSGVLFADESLKTCHYPVVSRRNNLYDFFLVCGCWCHLPSLTIWIHLSRVRQLGVGCRFCFKCCFMVFSLLLQIRSLKLSKKKYIESHVCQMQ